MNLKPFLDALRAAFPVGPVPARPVSEVALDSHEGARDLERALKGRAWSLLERSAVEANARHLVALSPAGFVHYLPAWLQYGAIDPMGEIATYAMYSLAPTGELGRYREETCAMFSPEQREVVARFLEALHEGGSFEMYTDDLARAVRLWRVA